MAGPTSPSSDAPASDASSELCAVRVIHASRVREAWQQDLPDRQIEAVSRTFKALGDPSRLRIVFALSRGEMCVCDLAAYLRISESAVSHQLRKLRDLALVRRRRDGQVLYYALDDQHVSSLIDQVVAHTGHEGKR